MADKKAPTETGESLKEKYIQGTNITATLTTSPTATPSAPQLRPMLIRATMTRLLATPSLRKVRERPWLTKTKPVVDQTDRRMPPRAKMRKNTAEPSQSVPKTIRVTSQE